MGEYRVDVVGYVETPFPEKFGIPRQGSLAPSAKGTVRFAKGYRHRESLMGLEGFSHLWLLFRFHQCPETWHPTVRPPRLGGNARVGVFASRSGFRPNQIGMSVVKLDKVDMDRLELHVSGVDLVDGTPLFDVKPYLPWSDGPTGARAGYAPPPESALASASVQFSDAAEEVLEREAVRRPHLKALLEEVLRADPRPAYQREDESRLYGLRLYHLNVRWRVTGARIDVLEMVVIP